MNENKLIRIVMEFTEGDGCTYSCTHTLPIMYESCEAALVDFDAAILHAKKNDISQVRMFGEMFWVYTFFDEGQYFSPDFMTVDEWFARGI